MKTPKAKIMGINTVLPHEQIHEDALLELLNQIKKDGKLLRPIAIDKNTKIIIDGHHRTEALKRLGIINETTIGTPNYEVRTLSEIINLLF